MDIDRLEHERPNRRLIRRTRVGLNELQVQTADRYAAGLRVRPKAADGPSEGKAEVLGKKAHCGLNIRNLANEMIEPAQMGFDARGQSECRHQKEPTARRTVRFPGGRPYILFELEAVTDTEGDRVGARATGFVADVTRDLGDDVLTELLSVATADGERRTRGVHVNNRSAQTEEQVAASVHVGTAVIPALVDRAGENGSLVTMEPGREIVERIESLAALKQGATRSVFHAEVDQ